MTIRFRLDLTNAAEQASRPQSEAAGLRVLIVEDVSAVARLFAAALSAEGMIVELAGSGYEAISRKLQFRPDVAIIDLALPDISGLDLVQRFARDGDCGVIVVTANDTEAVRLIGLDTGADDFLVKPPPLKELAARIRAVHRRLNRAGHNSGLRRPSVTLDHGSRCLVGPGRVRTRLTEAEHAALETLLDADGASVSREWLGRVALKRLVAADDRSVDQLVLKLRRKLALHGITDRAILSSRGLGYVVPDPGRIGVVFPSALPELVGSQE